QLLLSAHGAARHPSAGRHLRAALRRVSPLAAFAHHSAYGRQPGLDLLAFYGRPLALFVGTPLSGTVNCARDESRRDAWIDLVRRHAAVWHQLEKARHVAVPLLGHADLCDSAPDLQLP